MSIGIPVKVLHEAEGHIVTVETSSGEVYRGKLVEAEDNMNSMLRDVHATYRDGRQANLSSIYLRGSQICFMILPDMLKNAPMLRVAKATMKGKGSLIKSQLRGGGRGAPTFQRGGGRGGYQNYAR